MTDVLLIINTGTPDGCDTRSVRRYLSEFLNDPHVMDMPFIIRKLLVNLIIIPLRSPHSSMLYSMMWKKEGSPLLINLEKLVTKLQQKFKDREVIGAMRYGNPSLGKVLDELGKSTVNKLTVLPLYPQYAHSTTGSVKDLVMKKISKWENKPELKFIEEFYSDQWFIGAFANKIRKRNYGRFDHLLFSYHGLPVRHINKVHPGLYYRKCKCDKVFPEHGARCYRAQCYETSRLIAKNLNLKDGSWSVSFQSRLSRNWIEPFTDVVIKDFAAKGTLNVLVAMPSFTADCLETLVEVRQQHCEMFINAGGKELETCESLNYDDEWVDAIAGIIGIPNFISS